MKTTELRVCVLLCFRIRIAGGTVGSHQTKSTGSSCPTWSTQTDRGSGCSNGRQTHSRQQVSLPKIISFTIFPFQQHFLPYISLIPFSFVHFSFKKNFFLSIFPSNFLPQYISFKQHYFPTLSSQQHSISNIFS